MNRDILLPTYSDNTDYNADFDYFKVLITSEFARKTLQRIEMLKAVKKIDPTCFEVSFWDARGDYYAGEHEEGHDPTRTPHSSECDKMIVMDTGVYWECVPKHSELRITTEVIAIPQLELLAKEDM